MSIKTNTDSLAGKQHWFPCGQATPIPIRATTWCMNMLRLHNAQQQQQQQQQYHYISNSIHNDSTPIPSRAQHHLHYHNPNIFISCIITTSYFQQLSFEHLIITSTTSTSSSFIHSQAKAIICVHLVVEFVTWNQPTKLLTFHTSPTKLNIVNKSHYTSYNHT